jgi:GH25 family lysozyme M1 (1,4-beta-N-acetylmuramidase)
MDRKVPPDGVNPTERGRRPNGADPPRPGDSRLREPGPMWRGRRPSTTMPITRRPLLTFLVTLALAVCSVTAAPSARAGGRPDGAMGSSGEAARWAPGRVLAPRAGATVVRGIDVSHWQGTIDWARVAASGVRFAFLKATDDVDYTDPTFLANRAAARANGISVGAYHFARPDASPGDARREAKYFVKIAQPRAGDLLPVLDLETSQGLDQAGVTRWARTWVAEVRTLTGVTPLVYTSPYGWITRTGDTRLVARDGAPLWIAHWGVSAPTVPAGDWDGRGWEIWQRTSTGHVPGIVGNVDLDQLAGASLGAITIRRLSIAIDGDAGVVTSVPSGLGCASICARLVDPNTAVTLTAVPDPNAYFTGWSGACSGTTTTCSVQLRGNRTIGARFVTDITPPTPSLIAPKDATAPARVTFDERVRGVAAADAYLTDGSGARVRVTRVCRTATGVKAPCRTTAVRSVDLVPVDALVPGRAYEVQLNPPGAASLVVDRVGNPAAAATLPFRATAHVEQTQAPVIKRPPGAWSKIRSQRASGGSFAIARKVGAAVRMTFDGTGISLVSVDGPDRGRAQLWIDGRLVRTIDQYATTRSFGVVRSVRGLTEGTHVVRILVVGTRRAASAGTTVALDRLDVLG